MTRPPDPEPRPMPDPAPGETLPGERRTAGATWAFGTRQQRTTRAVKHPDLARATLLGLAGGAVAALLTAVLLAVLSITAGLVAVAVLGGWLIGVGVRTGAWSGRSHPPSRAPLALAALLGAVSWVGGLVLAWVVSMLILPASSMGFLDRLRVNPFLDWVSPQLGPLDLVQLALLVAVAWVAAHSTGLEREARRAAGG